MRVIVSGAIANKPFNGGEAWVRLSWLLGLKKLGCDVYFLEQIRPDTCLDADGHRTTFDASVNLAYFQEVIAAFGLEQTAALVLGDGDAVHGAEYKELIAVAECADLLVNISGHLTDPALFRRVRWKAYIDIDPGFTQYWHADGVAGMRLAGHDLFFTIGENIGTSRSSIPTAGIAWIPIRQPVVLDEWPAANGASQLGRFTTVASWRGPYGRVERDGRIFGLKVHEFRKFMALPRQAAATFEIALDIHPADAVDRASLLSHGWHLVDPRATCPDPFAFRRYVQQSDAEFSVAQGIYVETNSGWFSDRTVRYLASGKPALVQDTGFTDLYPAGEGLLAFRTLEEAATGAEQIARQYDAHCQAARRLAEEYFDSNKVLGRLLDIVEARR